MSKKRVIHFTLYFQNIPVTVIDLVSGSIWVHSASTTFTVLDLWRAMKRVGSTNERISMVPTVQLGNKGVNKK